MYRTSQLTYSLAGLRVDVDAYAASNQGLPEAQVRAAANAHNAAIDLALGEGEYAGLYEARDPLNPTPYDPGPTAVAVDSIVDALKQCYGPADRPNAEQMQDRVFRLASTDPAHPMAAAWQVLHARTYPYFDTVPAWPDVEAKMAAAG